MPLQATSGAASYDAFGGGAAAVPTFVEDVFSTYLYTGNGSTQTITNNINISGKGGMVWVKSRSLTYWHNLVDTVRGAQKSIFSNTTNAEVNVGAAGLSAFTSSGFSIGTEPDYNSPSDTYVSWTFRKQPKFFDVVTWTGTGSNTTISHGLGSVPACIMVKRTDTTGAWQVYHRSLANTEYLVLNATASAATGATRWNSTTPTSSVFSLGTDATVNASGGTYVAYLFAHDAGGFGLTGTDNVISCGSYTSNGSTISVNLGWEPQWILIKKATGAANNWTIVDSMRELTANATNASAPLFPNLTNAEAASSSTDGPAPNSTGFSVPYSSSAFNYPSGETYIYIAIRRGPMKVPTLGTSVFSPVLRTGTGADATVTGVGFAPDLFVSGTRTGGGGEQGGFGDKLRGVGRPLRSWTTAAERNDGAVDVTAYGMDGISVGNDSSVGYMNYAPGTYIWYFFKRAPSFMDVVCYAGTGSATTVTHNLAAVPELIIVKSRNGGAENWRVYYGVNQSMALNTTAAGGTAGPVLWNDTAPTASVFSVGTSTNTNGSGYTYVAYLFATCAGVSKVGSYTGTGTTLQVDCGFTAGARFVLIKKTSGTGSWYVWDSARGIVSGNDPYLLLNSTAAEVTNTDYIDTYSAGFEISSTAPSEINENGGSFIFFAVA
jgi:hypothetical protein